jgi:hypothetical protein
MPLLSVLLCGGALLAAPPEVPLAPWTSATHPQGLDFGGTMGISFGDYDADGFTDVFACFSGNLWRNVNGADWELVANVAASLPPTERRYGASFGDYDGDGLPDIAMAPRVPAWGDDELHLLHNLGDSLVDVAGDPSIVDDIPYGNAETLCWADVDADADLDLFVPVYPSWDGGGSGNFFLRNDGGHFVEASATAGLDNPLGTSRPEGAQFADVDGDGDLDLFANGTLYRNVSSRGAPRFLSLDGAVSGIGLRASLDEGAAWFDYDMDGDLDLAVAYSSDGVRLWENRGDGTFFAAEPGIVDQPMTGLNLGLSAEDWDGDGDVDFTTRGVFRRNRIVEDRTRHFTLASTAIPPGDLTSATPAWGDFDRDGDLDCALGNWGEAGKLYENVSAPHPYLRVRPVRDAPRLPRGLETEYGAIVEVTPSVADGLKRRKFLASSSGYLNQNEYALTFALPAGTADVSVDFTGIPAEGVWRVDRRVNPVLGGIDPGTLADHEIQVSRCGQVVLDGVPHDPIPLAPLRLSSTVPEAASASTEATAAPAQDWNAGIELDTLAASSPRVLREVILDGHVDAPKACSGQERNVTIWDVTDPSSPSVAGALSVTDSPRNGRTVFPADVVLAPGRVYRLVAHVKDVRLAPIPDTLPHDGVAVRGGLSFEDRTACSASRVASAALDPSAAALFVRFAALPADTRLDPLEGALRVSRGTLDESNLSWPDAGAPAYRVLRCAAPGPCTPIPIGETQAPAFTDPENPPPDAAFWYEVRATNGCGN